MSYRIKKNKKHENGFKIKYSGRDFIMESLRRKELQKTGRNERVSVIAFHV